MTSHTLAGRCWCSLDGYALLRAYGWPVRDALAHAYGGRLHVYAGGY